MVVDRKEISKYLFKKSKLKDEMCQELDYGINLILCWSGFEAFISQKYDRSYGNGKHIFCSEYSELFKNELESYKQPVQNLYDELNRMGLEDMTPRSNRQKISINSINNLEEILTVVHRVRSNFIHGGKEMGNRRNNILLPSSFKVIYSFFELILKEENWI